jgi:hypothetical protein
MSEFRKVLIAASIGTVFGSDGNKEARWQREVRREEKDRTGEDSSQTRFEVEKRCSPFLLRLFRPPLHITGDSIAPSASQGVASVCS